MKIPLILNVNDTESARYLVSRILTRAGFRVVEAETGGEALRLARELSPDLVVLDVRLPDISGLEVCRELKRDAELGAISIVQTSATFVTGEGKARGFESGADAYLTQPFEGIELVAMVRALLRLRATQQKARERAEALSAADRRKDEFLAMLAHELRNPLSAALTATRLLNGRLEKNSSDARLTETIGRQLGYLCHLVDDLLDVSRITHGKIALRTESLDLSTVLARAVESTRHDFDSKCHELVVERKGTTLVSADPLRLEQVLVNLLRNAAKYTPRGGHVRVTLESIADGEPVARVTVTDDGIGIPESALHSVFDLFYQGDRTLARTESGLGVGLTMVKQLVELHRGAVRVSSSGAGKGATFVIELPLLLDAATSRQSDAGSSSSALSSSNGHADDRSNGHADARVNGNARGAGRRDKLRVVLVDDNHDSCDLFGESLAAAGYDVTTAYDGSEGLDLVASGAFDVAVLDIGLPLVDGYELARRVRDRLGDGRPLMIALTGYGRSEDRVRALEAGFDAHFVKPIDVEAITKYVAGRSLRRTTDLV